jgi:Novel STAND NTPase 1
MSTAGGRLPYPGLRSFTREETDLFFGREGCVDDMVDRLAATRFLAVLGASGSGKSSLVKTGLLDALEIGLLHQAGSRWLIADFRPGEQPLHNMAEGLIKAVAENPDATPDEEEVKLLRTFLARGPRSVVEWCEANLPEGTNLLLLVDQFEELFRYGAYSEREEAEAFVATLLESAEAPLERARIYVAITMRSEYLGAAALIDGLSEAINRGLYLTPRMGRDEVREAIVGPAAVCGFSIEPALVNRLLNDLTSFAPWDEDDTGHQLERLVRRADQLPLMQHVLNRLWSIAAERSAGGPIVLELADYEAVGGLRGALAAHGREILEELLPEHRALAPTIFRALTAGSSLAEAVRRPTEFGELVAIAGGDEIAVREIIEAFRGPGRNFLMPPRPTPLRSTTLIDISHESLIRQWDEFAAWLQLEITAADTWRRLVDSSERYQRGEANLLSGLALASNASWWDHELPTAAWAKRYGGDFEQTAKFLADSRHAEEANEEARAKEQRQKSRNRMVTAAVIVILCIVTPLTAFAGYSAWRANQERAAAEVERQRALDAATAEAAAREEADRQREAAEAERQRALNSAQAEAAAREEADRQRVAAEAERQRALESARAETAAREEADRQRLAAEAERQRALDSARAEAAAREDADRQRQAAEDARKAAEDARQAAEVARQAAIVAAEREKVAARQAAEAQVELERQRAAQARAEFQRSNLELVAQRVSTLQQSGSWEVASNLLGTLWQDLIGADSGALDRWLIEPVVKAFARQRVAELPVLPDFLGYSGLEGWTGTSGRFRVYALDRKGADGSTVSGNKIIGLFDAMTGTALGSFELPSGADLGTAVDLVTPDGSRVAIVTDEPSPDDQKDDRQIALWADTQAAPIMVPMPQLDGEVGLDQIGPVNTGAGFALYFKLGGNPGEVAYVDPAESTITFAATTDNIAKAMEYDSIGDVTLLGLLSRRVIMLVNSGSDGRVLSLDTEEETVREIATDSGVTDAKLTPDGELLLTLTCPGDCVSQSLTAYDVATETARWVESVPKGMTMAQTSIHDTMIDGNPGYSLLVQNAGAGIILQIPQDESQKVVRLDAASHARMGEIAFDGLGGYRIVEKAPDSVESNGVAATGVLANYRMPSTRQKLNLYVAPNSIAVYRDGDTFRIAGVTYDQQLLVYRMRPDGEFEEDRSFRPMQISQSNCISAVAFGGDGRSLLFRHFDGSLLFVAAVGNGANVGWHNSTAAVGEARAELEASTPKTECDAPSESDNVERVVAADAGSTAFALLDKTGSVWWVDVVDQAPETGRQEQRPAGPGTTSGNVAATPAAAVATRGFAPLRRLAEGRIGIAGDPKRDRIALVSSSAIEVDPAVPPALATDSAVGTESASDSRAKDGTGGGGERQRILRWTNPKAVAFSSNGDIAVAYDAGRISGFHQDESGAWAVKFDATYFASPVIAGLFATDKSIAVADDHDRITSLDATTGTLIGHARLPANPSVLALRSDGRMLSVEWDTDAAASFDFADVTPPDDITDTARLVAMRSRRDQEADSNLDLLMADRDMERTKAAGSDSGCRRAAAQRLSMLELRLIGDRPDLTPAASQDCATADDMRALGAVEALAQRGQVASVRDLVEDAAFSRVLQAAAGGDRVATRILGAVLARIAMERGDLDLQTIAKDAVRFGTSVPSAALRAIAAGAPIATELLDAAREHTASDPTVAQLFGHWQERHINDLDSLAEALFDFSIAERLYRANGRDDDADFAGHRRAQLARLLPDERVLGVIARLDAWQPAETEIAGTAALPDIPSESAARHSFDMENANRLVATLPGSPLLEILTNELERARVFDLRAHDPKGAADLLITLGERTSAASGWSPDIVGEYLELADEIGGKNDPATVFRLAAEAIKLVAAGSTTPIDASGEGIGLFRRAGSLVADTVGATPKDAVRSELDAIDFGFLGYEFETLPAVGAEAEVRAVEGALESAAAMAEAVAANADDTEREKWNRLRARSLFWWGVLLNDHDGVKSAKVLHESADLMRPIVEANADDVEARFRYAEILRWVGIAEPSSDATAAIERESVKQFETVWDDRWMLDTDLLNRVGSGYGYALANLARTMREAELADLGNGRTAKDHAPWVLELLALAAEKDDVNAEMIDAGAITADATFQSGWYRMSTYGWPIGFLAGLVGLERGGQSATKCDLLAADPYDPLRRAPGLTLDKVDAAAAEEECRAEHDRRPKDGRTAYQLARVISSDTSREADYLPIARDAAAMGVSPAFSLVAYALSQKDDAGSGDAYIATAQRTLIESFPLLYPFLADQATTPRQRNGLAWLAGKAADLGVPEAHLALVDLGDDPVQKLFHAKLAERLFTEEGNTRAAAEADLKARTIDVPPAEASEVDSNVAAWQPRALVELPADAGAS